MSLNQDQATFHADAAEVSFARLQVALENPDRDTREVEHHRAAAEHHQAAALSYALLDIADILRTGSTGPSGAATDPPDTLTRQRSEGGFL